MATDLLMICALFVDCYSPTRTVSLVSFLLERAITALEIERDSRGNLCDHVIAEAQQLMKKFHDKQLDDDRKIQELQSAYRAREKLLHKTWCVDKDNQHHLELERLTHEYEKRVQIMETETEQRIAAMKKHMEATMASGLEFARIQLKMQAKAVRKCLFGPHTTRSRVVGFTGSKTASHFQRNEERTVCSRVACPFG